MNTFQETEESNQALPAQDLVLAEPCFESPELEAALLQSLDAPRHEVNEALFSAIRSRTGH